MGGGTFLPRHLSVPSASSPPPPNAIDTIISSLSNCSLSSSSSSSSSHRQLLHPFTSKLLPVSPSSDIAVELKSQLPLSYPWEQVLNLQTGVMYYINRGTGTKTSNDPRELNAAGELSPELERDGWHAISEEDGSKTWYCRSGDTNSASSSNSTAASWKSRRKRRRRKKKKAERLKDSRGASEVLVLVGCRLCLTLSMVSNTGEADCPKCGGQFFLHF